MVGCTKCSCHGRAGRDHLRYRMQTPLDINSHHRSPIANADTDADMDTYSDSYRHPDLGHSHKPVAKPDPNQCPCY